MRTEMARRLKCPRSAKMASLPLMHRMMPLRLTQAVRGLPMKKRTP